MKFCKENLLLYGVTDRAWLAERTLCEVVEQALAGGATMIQLREKNLDTDAFLREARALSALCRRYDVPFLINDNVEIALAVEADGVHIGQKDQNAKEVRARIGNKILGVSAQTVAQAIEAEENGADYLGVGAVFPTSTKGDADAVSTETLRSITEAVSIPVCAIGGIGAANLPQLKGSGIDGVALVSAIFAASDIRVACERLLPQIREVIA